MTFDRSRWGRTLVVVTAATMTLAACGLTGHHGTTSPTAVAAPVAPVSISMSFWGDFGLDALADEYEQAHPGVTITLDSGNYNDVHDQLQRDLVAGTGAPTIVAIGDDYIGKFTAQPDSFVNLLDLGAGDYQDSYLKWKWAEGATADGTTLVGIGADVSGLAMCYRRDLFEKAGLPSDRDAVAAAIGDTWEGFIALGKQYAAASTHGAFLDDASTLLRPIREQLGASYYDASGALNTDAVEPAFDLSLDAIDGGLSAGITPFSDQWDAGLDSGAFAVTLCPVWSMGYIQSLLETNQSTAQWDIADIPGPGGSWGGSFYAIPSQSSPVEQRAAWEFLRWLIQPEQQIRIFQATGSLPSQPALYDDDSVQKYSIPFFNDAPVGPLLATSVTELPTQSSYAPKNGTVEAAVQQVLSDVEQGNVALSDAWSIAQDAATTADQTP